MIIIRDVETVDGRVIDHVIHSQEEVEIDGKGLTLFPGLIDPHVHFRTPGLEHKEDWRHAARAALAGGITTVFDMPNTLPPTITHDHLEEKKKIIDIQLNETGIPLHYHLYLGADKSNFPEIEKAKGKVIGLKVLLSSSIENLQIDDEESLHKSFQLAAEHGLVLALHAETEANTKKAIDLAKLYNTKLYLLHVGSKEELARIGEAKQAGLSVFAETTVHHLFLNEKHYERCGHCAHTNPPEHSQEDCDALWEAIQSGIIDTIGSDHAPHTMEEKNVPYGCGPSGIPGIETTLPLLISSKRLTHSEIVRLMKTKIEDIFSLPSNEDAVLVDVHRSKIVDNARLHTKCGWSPYAGQFLKGWPVITFLKGRIYRHG